MVSLVLLKMNNDDNPKAKNKISYLNKKPTTTKLDK